MPDEWEPQALGELKRNLQGNIDGHAKVKEAFYGRYGTTSADALASEDPQQATSQSVLKWLVDAAHRNSIKLIDARSFQYRRYNPGISPYLITKQMILLKRGEITALEIPFKKPIRQGWMEDDLVTCIEKHRPVDVEEKLYSLMDTAPSVAEGITADISALCALVS